MKWRDAWRFINATVAAGGRRSDADKARALKAQTALRDDRNHPDRCFVYNATLNLIDRGVAPTDKNILEESRRIAKANEVHFTAQKQRRDEIRKALA